MWLSTAEEVRARKAANAHTLQGMEEKLRALAARQGDVFSYQDALACGLTLSQIRDRVRRGAWLRLCRGQYTMNVLDPAAPRWQRAAQRHLLRTVAAVHSLQGDVAVSHHSAVVAYGLPTWGADLATVHVTRRDGQTGRRISGVVQHRAQLESGSVWLREDLQVVTPARAIVEVACTAGFEPGLVIADEALRRRIVSRRALEFALCEVVSWPGSPAAQHVVDFCDPRAESVGESRLRVLMDREGLPAPALQTAIVRDCEPFAFVDFFFGHPYNTVVEFDGIQKYGEGAAAVVREKGREDVIRELGYQVVRTVWADLDAPKRTAARIRQAFARSESAARTG